MLGNLHPLRQLAVLIPSLAHSPFEGRGGEKRFQKLPDVEVPKLPRVSLYFL
jgi:hypothetical protein